MTQNDTFGVDVFGADLGANIPSIGRSGDHLSPTTTVTDVGPSIKEAAEEATPDYLPEAVAGVVGVIVLTLLAVAFGQLFTVEL